MYKYKLSSFTLLNEDNYLMYLKRLGYIAVRLLTHKEMYQSQNLKMTEVAIPDPA
jgi:hypothetical protein